MLKTTLTLLRKANACSEGMRTLTAALGPKWTDDKKISLSVILKSNGLDHAIWAFRATTIDSRRNAALFAIDCAYLSIANFETVFPEDKRPRDAIKAASDFLDGKITLAMLEESRSAAWAAESAAWAARSAAWAAESARAAESAASAARSAAWAARSAARSAAESARAAESAAWAARSAAESAALQKKAFLKRIRTPR